MPKSYVARFFIALRYGYYACGYGRFGSVIYALTDPIASLNPIYSKPAYVEAMVRNTARAIDNTLWYQRVERLTRR